MIFLVLSSSALAMASGPALNGGSACTTFNGGHTGGCSAPTPTPPPSSPAPTYNGCAVYSATDPTWNTNVSAVAADTNSASYMTTMLGVSSSWFVFGNHSNAFWDINQATGSTYNGPYVESNLATLEYNVTTFPFLASFKWQGQGGTGDHHLMTVRNSDCTLNEAYSNTNEASTGPSWKATTAPAPVAGTTAVVEDVTNRQFVMQCQLGNVPYPTPAPTGLIGGTVRCPINHATQLGGPVFPSLVRWEDFQNNSPHAVGIDGPTGYTLNNSFVYPAGVNCGVCGTTAGLPPLGAHVVMLPAATASVLCYNSNPSLSTCPEASFIMNCLLQFGGYFTDQGASGFTIRLGNDSTGADQWSSTDVNNLNNIAVNSTNFKFIKPPFASTTIANCIGNLNPNGC